MAVLILCCCSVVLTIVNGQPTIDNDVDRDEIAQLRAELRKSVARIAKLEGQVAALSAKKSDQGKFIISIYCRHNFVIFSYRPVRRPRAEATCRILRSLLPDFD